MGVLLNILYAVATVALSPWIAYRLTRTASWPTLAARAGIAIGPLPRGGLWLHAASVGEVSLLRPLVRLLETELPDIPVVISTFTRTGQAAARASFPGHATIYLPLDLDFIVRRFLDRCAPCAVVIVESELWPNFLGETLRRGTPVAVLNGKMSARSARIHARLRIVSRLLPRLAFIAVQDDAHAARFRALGAPSERVAVTGNMKYDLAGEPPAPGVRAGLRAGLHYRDDDVVVVGGSLHRGEERVLLDALDRCESACGVVIVPRYPEDARTVAEVVRRSGRRPVLQSEVDAGAAEPPGTAGVLVVDVIGRLGCLYAAADIAFVGGSLFYRGSNKGGHNLMEPAIVGIPVAFGPYNLSFRETADSLLANDAGACVANADELAAVLDGWMASPAQRGAVGKRARSVVEQSRGATRRNFGLIEALLKRSPGPPRAGNAA